MSSVTNILKCVTQLQGLAQELEAIARQVTAEVQLAQDAQAREEEIREETRLFLERLNGQRKRSGSANSVAKSTSKKAVALSSSQGSGKIRVEVSPEKPEVTTSATAGVAYQGPSGKGGAFFLSQPQTQKHTTTLSQVAFLLQRTKEQEEKDQCSLPQPPKLCMTVESRESSFMPPGMPRD